MELLLPENPASAATDAIGSRQLKSWPMISLHMQGSIVDKYRIDHGFCPLSRLHSRRPTTHVAAADQLGIAVAIFGLCTDWLLNESPDF